MADNPRAYRRRYSGNVVHCIGVPHYAFAVIIAGEPNATRGLHLFGNLFTPGSDGVSNTVLPP